MMQATEFNLNEKDMSTFLVLQAAIQSVLQTWRHFLTKIGPGLLP